MKLKILLTSIFLLTGAIIIAGCSPGNHDHSQDQSHEHHAHDELSPDEMEGHVLEAHTDEDGNIVYVCPMHPEVRENEPDSCPICGMNLVALQEEVEQDHSTHETHTEQEADNEPRGRLRISPTQQQLIGMQYDTVSVRELQHSIRTVGVLDHAEPNLTDITPRVGGFIEEVHVAETGVHVMEGEPLVTIYSPELISSQEDYLIALERGNDNLARRARERLRLLLMPESEIRKLEEQREPLLEVIITAPVQGHVMIMNARKGMEFSAGSLLYRINNHTRLWLLADIYEDDLPFVSIGQNVTYQIQGQADTRQGTISFIPPLANSETRTVPVRIEVPNPDFALKMKQYARVTLHEELGERLSVHRDAVLKTGLRNVVFVERGEGRFEPVEVHLGLRSGDYYEVLHGLNEGERVVTSGRFWIDAESRLRGVGADAMPGHQH